MFDRFTDRARMSMAMARKEAQRLNHPFIGTEHMLLGVLHVDTGAIATALGGFGHSLDAVRAVVELNVKPGSSMVMMAQLPFTPQSKRALELSLVAMEELEDQHIEPEHLFLGLLRQRDGVAAHAFVDLGLDVEELRLAVAQQRLPEGCSGGDLRSDLRSDQPRVRANALWRTVSSPLVSELFVDVRRLIRDDPDPFVQQLAIRIVGRHTPLAKAREALPDLIVALRSPNGEVRAAASRELVEFADPTAVPDLRVAVNDPAPEVRTNACACLANLGTQALEALPTMIGALTDSCVDVRRETGRYFRNVGPRGKEALPALSEAMKDAENLRLYRLAHVSLRWPMIHQLLALPIRGRRLLRKLAFW